MAVAWDGQGGSNGNAPPSRGRLPRGQSALDVIVEGGFLALGSGPVEFAAWLRAPVDYISANVNALVAAAVATANAPTLAAAAASAATAAASAATATADAVATAADVVAAAASAAAAAATAATIMANKASAAEIIAGTEDTKYSTSKGLADAGLWVASTGPEFAGSTWTPDGVNGFNRTRLGITANLILGAPTNLKNGQTYSFMISQDGTGGRTITPNAIFDFGSDAFVANTVANKINIITGIYNATTGKLHCHYWKSA